MFDAIKKADAGYAGFVSRMLAAEAAEIADIAKINAYQFANQIVAANVDSNASTVAPRKAR